MKPIFIEYSKFPVWLSKFTPIDIWAINIGWWVWCRGKLRQRDKIHETVHLYQQVELLFIFQWLLYGIFYVIGLIKYRDGKLSYSHNPFEQEAYANEKDNDYLSNRLHYAWWIYKI